MLQIDSNENATRLEDVSMKDKNFEEDNLREWIISNPQSVLGERLLLIGREASVKHTRDAIDLLGIDRDGNVVIIELKREALSGTDDFQGLKYAAYASHWDYSKLRDQFEKSKGNSWRDDCYDDGTTFTEALDDFCNDDYSLNQDQRILLVGESIRDRLDFVLKWLSDRDVDVTVIEYQLHSDGDHTYLDAGRTIPLPGQTMPDVGPNTSEQPWKNDGRSWHLQERTGEKTGDHLEEVIEKVNNIEFLDGPEWTQKLYLSFKQNKKIQVKIRTHQNLFHIDVYNVPTENKNAKELAERFGISEEMVKIDNISHGNDRSGIQITCGPDRDIDLDEVKNEIQELLTAEEN